LRERKYLQWNIKPPMTYSPQVKIEFFSDSCHIL
jgi:hypothetical protein